MEGHGVTEEAAAPHYDPRRFVRNFGTSVAGEGIAKGAAFLAGILVARTLTPDDYGRFSFVVALVSVGLLASDVGLQVAATRLIAADRPRSAEFFGAALTIGEALAGATYVVLVALALAGVLPDGTTAPLAIFGTVLMLAGAFNPPCSVLRGHERQDLVYASYSLASVVLLGAIIAAAALGASLSAICAVYAGSYAVRLVATFGALRAGVGPMRPRFTRSALRLVLFAAPGTAIAVSMLGVYAHVDVFLLGLLVPAADVGNYAAAYRLVDASTFLTAGALTAVTLPIFARVATIDRDAARDLYDRLARLLTALLVPGALLVAALSAPIIRLVYGPELEGAGRLLALLSPSIPLIAANYLTVFLAIGVGLTRVAVGVTVVAALVNIAVNLGAIPTIGVEGAALATYVTEALLVAAFAVALTRAQFGSRGFVAIVSGAVLVAVPFALAEAFDDERGPILVAGAGVAAAIAWAAGFVRREDLGALRRAVGR
jgi:O-antigen/teichoic acid export membrane protein